MKYNQKKEKKEYVKEHSIEIVANYFVRKLFIWAYKKLDRITFYDEDKLPTLEIRNSKSLKE